VAVALAAALGAGSGDAAGGRARAAPGCVRATRVAARPVCALRLGDGSSLVELLVDRDSLRPVVARYVSRTTAGSSDLLPVIRLHRSRPTGC
jgi:hypothetical protein